MPRQSSHILTQKYYTTLFRSEQTTGKIAYSAYIQPNYTGFAQDVLVQEPYTSTVCQDQRRNCGCCVPLPPRRTDHEDHNRRPTRVVRRVMTTATTGKMKRYEKESYYHGNCLYCHRVVWLCIDVLSSLQIQDHSSRMQASTFLPSLRRLYTSWAKCKPSDCIIPSIIASCSRHYVSHYGG